MLSGSGWIFFHLMPFLNIGLGQPSSSFKLKHSLQIALSEMNFISTQLPGSHRQVSDRICDFFQNQLVDICETMQLQALQIERFINNTLTAKEKALQVTSALNYMHIHTYIHRHRNIVTYINPCLKDIVAQLIYVKKNKKKTLYLFS